MEYGDVMSQDYLDPKLTTAISPAADKNVATISPCCLDVNAKSAYLMRGRAGGVWWMIWMLIGASLLILQTLGNQTTVPQEVAFALLFLVILFGLSILRFVHIWRTHLPIRFNRQTRKVYLHYKKKTYILDWDTIRAYLAFSSDPDFHLLSHCLEV